ncbi:MAG: aminotransferase class I/II-fold pyridoxal phosphate-dependent enzyme, partial [Arcobacteraceae bacterium]
IRADESLLNPLIPYKEAMDLHTNGLSQYILNDYLNNIDDFYTHLDSLRASYKNKMLLFKKYLDIYLPQFEYVEPKGGMFIYGKLPNINTALLVQECLKNDVVFVPGIEFYNDASITDEIRFNFTHTDEKNIEIGLSKIAEIVSKTHN